MVVRSDRAAVWGGEWGGPRHWFILWGSRSPKGKGYTVMCARDFEPMHKVRDHVSTGSNASGLGDKAP